MANFFLIDQSLNRPGGHHCDYASCVAKAANELGFLTTIGTHRRLNGVERIDNLGKVRRVFRNTTYQRDSYLSGLRHLTRAKRDYLQTEPKAGLLKRWSNHFGDMRHRSRREKFIRVFAQDCQNFFQPAMFTETDHAFFTTVSELELMGLAAFLAAHPRTLQVHWHLQFHYNLFEGRTPEYQKQLKVARAVQSCFDAALSRIPYHQIHFYTTSETLADQYNRLGVGDFEVLPYPVSPRFWNKGSDFLKQSSESDAVKQLAKSLDRPLRITCPGGTRREKGVQDYLQPLVDKIWNPHLDSGRVKIVVQRSSKGKLDLNLPSASATPSCPDDPVEYLSHPLSDEDYIKFIKTSDCGLLFYDSRVYFSRRAGVLGELLSCGKPVIVPAGSWLSEQIQGPIFEHANELCSQNGIVRQLEVGQLDCGLNNVPHPGGIVSFDQANHPFVFQFERMSTENGLTIGFDWHWPDVPGVFATIEVNEFDIHGNFVVSKKQVVGQRRELADSVAFFALNRVAHTVKIRIKNSFHDSNASIKNLQVNTISCGSESPPRGAVGIIAADQEDLSNCVDELVEHYDHYRESAAKFAMYWARQHEPKRTVAKLISNQLDTRRVA